MSENPTQFPRITASVKKSSCYVGRAITMRCPVLGEFIIISPKDSNARKILSRINKTHHINARLIQDVCVFLSDSVEVEDNDK